MSPSTVFSPGKKEFASEIKFVLPAPVAEHIRAWARARLLADPNAAGATGDTYRITSIYFDTENFDVFHRQRRLHHSKFRVRRYGDGSDAALFLERKFKARGRLAKRRAPVAEHELARLAHPYSGVDWPGRWFHHRLAGRQLRPVCQITYHRTARVLMTAAGPIRLTLDDTITARPAGEIAFQDPAGGLPLGDGQTILELKYRQHLPAVFRELAERFALRPRPFSKYRTAAAALGLVTAATAPAAETENILLCQIS